MALSKMKVCYECEETKPRDEFYFHAAMADQRLGICKACHRLRMRIRARTNPAVQEYDRRRSKLPERVAQTVKVTRNWRKRNPEKYRAHAALNYAVKCGKISKGCCESCGSDDNVHGHHTDYSRPLDVIWLCAKCHQRSHADEKCGELAV